MTDRPLRRRPRGGLALACLALLAPLLPVPAQAVDDKDLLPVDEAFVLSASAPAADRIAIDWKVAKGYYLYKHRISVKADAGFAAQPLRLPKGKAYRDEFFGDVETYRERVTAELPGAPKAARTTLTIKYQGCADAGICYPPQTRSLSVALPAATAAAMAPAAAPAADPVPAGAGGFGPLGAAASNPLLGGQRLTAPTTADRIGGATDALPLPPEQAFGFEAIARDGDTLLLRFTPARGYYLYRDKTALKTDRADIAAGKPQWPRGTPYHDEHFGAVTVFFDQIDVPVPLLRKTAEAGRVVLTASFQGCQTDGICYPPMTRKVTVELPRGTLAAAAAAGAGAALAATSTAAGGPASAPPAGAVSGAPAATPATGLPPGPAAAVASDPVPPPAGALGSAAVVPTGPGEPAALAGAGEPTAPAGDAQSSPAPGPAPQAGAAQSEDARLAAGLAGSGELRWLALLAFFTGGIVSAFTACVLPMIPILSGLIAGASSRQGGISVGRALGLTTVYILGNAVVFAAAGVVAGLLGANLQAALQTPWALTAFAALFVVLALSNFGLYELQLPAALRNRIGALSDRQKGGSWAGVAIMGALSSLIVGPCVTPQLAGGIAYIANTGDPVFGGLALFLLALGMGVPLLAFGLAAGKGLPTSGPWMVAMQRVFGFVFLGLAVWMLSRILPGPVVLALWGVLAMAAAVALGLAAARQGPRAGAPVFLMALGALLLGVLGLAQLIGALAGSRDPLQPLAGLAGGRAAQPAELAFRKIKSSQDLDREIAAAQAAGRPLLLDFYADWCVACKEMEKYTFPDPQVHRALDGFVLLKADVTANDETDQALMKRLEIFGPPATLYYVAGAERRELRLFGFEKAPDFARRAERARPAAAP